MSRPIVLSNGEMHVGLNHYGEVHDFYFPYVGLENHAAASGLRHRIGVMVNDHFSWIDDGTWEFSYKYHDRALVSDIVATHHELNIRLEFTDCVDASQSAFVRNIHVINTAQDDRTVKLYMHQVFVIANSRMSDTVQYRPEDNAIMHYKGRRVFIVGGEHEEKEPFDDYSMGMFGIEGREGTFKDAEDGVLQRNVVEHGRVDSVIGFYMTIKALSSHRVFYWVAAGRSTREALTVHNTVKANGVLHSIMTTAAHWREWLKPSEHIAAKLSPEHGKALQNSLMLIKSHIDKRGAVIASLDTTMLNYSKDMYSYCWPRDAGYVLWPLLRAGYREEILNFLAFARRGLQDGGYLYHKYQADGALGSSWHPWTHPYGIDGPPIQTDETAIVLFLAGQYYRMHDDKNFLTTQYAGFIEPMANFLAYHTDHDGLPLPSYDLWEEKYQSHTYTAAITYASLLEAADMADVIGNADDGARWRAAAEAMKSAAHVYYNPDKKFFYKGFIDDEQKQRHFDDTIDVSSLFGCFMYGLFDKNSEEVQSSIQTARAVLRNSQEPNAFVRYEHDGYYRDGDATHESNPWPVVSLWMAQMALVNNDEEFAKLTLNWIVGMMSDYPSLSEQVRPDTFQPTSVEPLTWSHAELVSTLIDITQR